MSIETNLHAISEKIAEAQAGAACNNGEIKLVAVSKYHSIDEIKAAYACGQRVFAENRVQELLPKIEALSDEKDIEWHLIGHLQKNKVKQIVGKVALIQSVDSIDLLREVEKRACQMECNVDILLQVNLANEPQKSGIAFEDIDSFIDEVTKTQRVFLKGLMFIAPNLDNKEELRPYFKQLSEKYQALKAYNNIHVEMKWLSMGMSGDYEYAIIEGANMIRVGSAVFNV